MVPKTRHSTNFNDFCNNNNLKKGEEFSCVAFCVVAVQPLNGDTIQKPDQNINTFSNGFNQFLYSPNTTTANRNTPYPLTSRRNRKRLTGRRSASTFHYNLPPGGGGTIRFSNCPFEPDPLHVRYLFPLHKSRDFNSFRPLTTLKTSEATSKTDAVSDA